MENKFAVAPKGQDKSFVTVLNRVRITVFGLNKKIVSFSLMEKKDAHLSQELNRDNAKGVCYRNHE